MRDRYHVNQGQGTYSEVCSERCVRAVTKIHHDRRSAALNQVSGCARAVVSAIRAR